MWSARPSMNSPLHYNPARPYFSMELSRYFDGNIQSGERLVSLIGGYILIPYLHFH